MDSVLQDEKKCWFCHTTYGLESHHCLHGTANRKIAEKYGLKVWLCNHHHTGQAGVHKHKEFDLVLEQLAQTYYEEHYGTREDFIKEFGKNYL